MNEANIQSSYRDVIEKNGFYIASPVGISMMPLIRQGIDTVKLVKPQGRVKKYDVILYDRPNGAHILHRVVKVRKNSYDLCGDNQVNIEHGVTDDMIVGVVEGIYRGEEYTPVTDLEYIKYSKKIVRSRLRRKIKYYFNRLLIKLKIKKAKD